MARFLGIIWLDLIFGRSRKFGRNRTSIPDSGTPLVMILWKCLEGKLKLSVRCHSWCMSGILWYLTLKFVQKNKAFFDQSQNLKVVFELPVTVSKGEYRHPDSLRCCSNIWREVSQINRCKTIVTNWLLRVTPRRRWGTPSDASAAMTDHRPLSSMMCSNDDIDLPKCCPSVICEVFLCGNYHPL